MFDGGRARRLVVVAVLFLLLVAVFALSSCTLLQGPKGDRLGVKGRVTIEGTSDYSDVNVQVRYWDDDAWEYIVLGACLTDSSGYYDLSDLPMIPGAEDYSVYAWKTGYAPADDYIRVGSWYDGSPVDCNLKLHNQKMMAIDWVYTQGSYFAGGVSGSGTIYSYVIGSERDTGYDFDYVAGHETWWNTNVQFYDDDEHKMTLYSWSNRLWDMGAVPLNSVTTVPTEGGKRWSYIAATVGHTYVVETDYGYAKFYVKSMGEAGIKGGGS